MDYHSLIPVIIAFIFWLSGFYFLFRITHCFEADKIKFSRTCSIIIPARNEEDNIGILLDSINIMSFKPDEIIVVNDHSTDKTREIALKKNAFVIDADTLPAGWLGKPWACYQGAVKSTGDLLIFLDADTKLEPEGLQKITGTFAELSINNIDPVISIVPFHKIVKFYEEFSAVFNIIMTGSMNAFTPIKKSKPYGLFGQSLIISRQNYFRINGHEAVKDKILENMFMAGLFRNQNVPIKCFSGKGTLSFRMYSHGFRELVNGWSKAFASGAAGIPFFSLLNIISWISAGFTIFIFLIMSLFNNMNFLLWLFLYLLFSAQIYRMLKGIGTFRVVTPIIYPLHLLFFCIIFSRSLYLKITGKKIQWKSREV